MRRHLSFCDFLVAGVLVLALSACGTSSETAQDTAEDEAGPASNFDITETDSAGFAADDEAMEEEPAEEVAAEEESEPALPEADTSVAADVATADTEAAAGEVGAAPLTATQQTAADLGRKIIFTADIIVEVDDVAAAGRAATDAIAGLGGFVFGQQTQGGTEPRSTLTFKVLPEDFDAAVDALGSVGELVSQSVSADDVTERVIDLQTRMEVAQLGVERLRQALTESQDLEDYAELERLLLDRESELEVMRGSLRTLQDRIDLATITVTLIQNAINHSITLDVTRYDLHDTGASCPGDFGSEGAVEAGTETTLCLEIINTGDEPLADLTVIDTALGIAKADDVITVFGDLAQLEAGQSVMVAHEFTADRAVRLRPKVTARPITVDGGGANEPAGPPIDVRADGFVDVFEPQGEPGFGEGFGAGLSVLSGIWTVLRVTVGFVLPLLIPLAITGALLLALRRQLGSVSLRRRRDGSGGNGRLDGPPPPRSESAVPTVDPDGQSDDK